MTLKRCRHAPCEGDDINTLRTGDADLRF